MGKPHEARRPGAGPRIGAPRATPRLSLTVQYAISRRRLPHRSSIERWARGALARDAALTVRFVGEREGRTLNARFRRRSYATNVLTFGYEGAARSDPDTSGGTVGATGDIVLCAPVVAREALAQGKPLRAHYAHLIVHGVLHLQGFDHVQPAQAARMEARERDLLGKFGFGDPYA